MTLQKQRAEWENPKYYAVLAESPPQTIEREGRCLVVLRRKTTRADDKQPYVCHRYFSIGENWECSVDAQYASAETALKWALNPKAMPRESEEE